MTLDSWASVGSQRPLKCLQLQEAVRKALWDRGAWAKTVGTPGRLCPCESFLSEEQVQKSSPGWVRRGSSWSAWTVTRPRRPTGRSLSQGCAGWGCEGPAGASQMDPGEGAPRTLSGMQTWSQHLGWKLGLETPGVVASKRVDMCVCVTGTFGTHT